MFDLNQNIASLLKPANVQDIAPGDQRQNHRDFSHGQQRKKKDTEDPTRELSNGVMVSVQGLIFYLEDLMENKLAPSTAHINEKKDNFAPWLKQAAHNNNTPNKLASQRATQAYSHTSKTASPLRRQQTSEHLETLKSVYDLIQELRSLEKKGIHEIRISSEYSFVDSIRFALTANKTER